MLRAVSTRAFSTTQRAFAAKPVKAVAQGFKKDKDFKKNKKTAGSHKRFHDFVHSPILARTAIPLDLPVLSAESSLGDVVSFGDRAYKRLVVAGSFQKDQFRELFEYPLTLIREETQTISNIVKSGESSESKNNRVVVIGEGGIGKSTLIAQAQALIPEQAILLPVSYARKLVDGTNDFLYDSNLGKYTQPMFLKKFLSKVKYINQGVLSQIKLTQDYAVESLFRGRPPTKFSTSNTLDQVLAHKFSGRQQSAVFEILVAELSKQKDIPVYLTVDNFGSLMHRLTAYHNAENKPISVLEMQFSNWILSLVSGEKSFAKGGVILATSQDDVPSVTLNAGLGLVKADAYDKTFDAELASKLKDVQVLEVSKLSRPGVSALVQQFVNAGVFRKDEIEARDVEGLAGEKYILSGGGNPKELFKSVTMFY